MYINFTLFKLKIIFLLINNVICKRYDNYTLYRVIPVTEKQVKFFQNVTELYNINMWRPPSKVHKAVEFVIGPQDKEMFIQEAEYLNLYLTTLLGDVQSAFDKQTVKPYVRRKLHTFDWENFYRVDDIYNWLRDLKKQYPEQIELDSIGTTFEGREILAARLALKGSKLRSTVVIEGGIHAREWIGPAFVTYLLFTLLHASDSNNKALKKVAYTYEFYFVPVLNPDGYEYTHKEDRLWRKNRSFGTGVDVNRNFDIAFGKTGVSFNRKSETFCGSKAFSELESSAMSQFLRSISQNLEYYLAFHSYGQYMILPYAYTKKHEENYDEVKKMIIKAAREIKRKYNTKYTYGTAYDTVGYTTSGVSGCWVKKSLRVPYVVTFELRDTGTRGFGLLPKDIKPTCEETLDGVVSLLTPRSAHLNKLKNVREDVLPYTNNDMRFFLSNVILFFYIFLVSMI